MTLCNHVWEPHDVPQLDWAKDTYERCSPCGAIHSLLFDPPSISDYDSRDYFAKHAQYHFDERGIPQARTYMLSRLPALTAAGLTSPWGRAVYSRLAPVSDNSRPGCWRMGGTYTVVR